jgi:hypothetical protein
MDLPPRSAQLIRETPLHERPTGVMACVEFTVYDGGHTAIAVSRVDGSPGHRVITQADSLPLNSVDELRDHLLGVLAFVASSRHTEPRSGRA